MNTHCHLRAGCAAVLALTFAACEELPPAPGLPNAVPTATLYLTPVAPIYAGETPVAFSAVGARDTDGRVVSYVWNFGDGTPELATAEPAVTHTFPDTPGRCLDRTYGVLLAVVDDQGERGFVTQPVTVTELPAPSSAECQGR
ncbi:MAG: PKD domain-containing protein [Vicinamibacteria bacterium]